LIELFDIAIDEADSVDVLVSNGWRLINHGAAD
jgi:hypothetical protein